MVVRLPTNDPDRLARISNTKWLHTGVDLAALEAQKRRKQELAEAQAEEARQQAALEAAQVYVAESEHNKEAQLRASVLKDLQNYRDQSQGRPKARDWDLSRPDRLKIDRPARVNDDDPDCGVASIQKFAGEDLSANIRHQQHIDTNRQLWEMQAQARAAQAAAEAANKRYFQQQVKELDALQTEARKREEAGRAATERELLAANKDLEQQKRAAQEADIAFEKEEDKGEIAFAEASDFLTEHPAQAVSAANPHRLRNNCYKGMGKEEVEQIRGTQLKQALDLAVAISAQKSEERAFEQSQAALLLQLRRTQLQAEITKQQQSKENGRFLKSQAAEKAGRDAALRALYSNEARPAYFDQFETSHR